MEDGYIYLLTSAKRKIQFHIFGREPVFMDKGTNNPLSHQFLRCFLNLFSRYVVECVPGRNSALSMSLIFFLAHRALR